MYTTTLEHLLANDEARDGSPLPGDLALGEVAQPLR